VSGVDDERTVRKPVNRPRELAADDYDDDEPERLGQLGRYQLLFELGRGGMATVYVGRLIGVHGFDRLVAIKRLAQRSASAEEVADFLDEARITAHIRHPNVVQTLDLGEHDGAPYIVMQLVEGVSLAQLLGRLARQGESLDADLAAWIVGRAAAGLHAAHELHNPQGESYGLVHRDVSPENILLSYDGRVCVADFGVAKFVGAERATQSGVVKGKFGYMSPEQTEAVRLDRRSDVFSLGIVLYECLSGERLFAGKSAAETIRRVNEQQPADPRDQRPEVPTGLVQIAARCLEKSRAERFATAGQVAEELRSLLRQRRVTVDEGDLSDLLERHFTDERRKLRRRIQARIAAGQADVGMAVDSSSESSNEVDSVIASVHTVRPRKSRWLWGSTAALGLVGLSVGAYLWQRQPLPPAPSFSAATSQDPVSSQVPSKGSGSASAPSPKTNAMPSVQPRDGGPSGRIDGSAGSHAPDAAATTRPRPLTTAKRPTAALPVTSGSATNTVPTSPPVATTSSVGGKPFRDFDP